MENLPVGTTLPYLGTLAPAGFILADGRELNKEAYADLFYVIRDDYGSTSATTFNVPDLRGRLVVGAGQNADTSLSDRTLGATGGEEQTNSIPANDGNADNTIANPANVLATTRSGMVALPSFSSSAPNTTITGSSQEGNMPPYIILNYIIYTGVYS